MNDFTIAIFFLFAKTRGIRSLIQQNRLLWHDKKEYEQDFIYYFGKKFSEGRNAGQVVLCANELEDKFDTLDDIRKYWDDLKEEDYVKEFAHQIYMYNSVVCDYDAKANRNIQPIDIIRKIMEMDIPDSEK